MASSGGGGWKAAIFIIVVEMAERFSFYGLTSGLLAYLSTALGESTADAAKHVNLWQGVAFLFPLIGAFVADSVLGRFKTVFYSSILYLLGMILLVISSSVIPARLRRPFVYLSLYIIASGEGGHKPSVQTFAADQFDESTPEEKAAKSSFFNYWYCGVVVGSGSGIATGLYFLKVRRWTRGFSIGTATMLVSLVVFLSGTRFYRREDSPSGSSYTTVAQVFVAAVRKCRASEDKFRIFSGEDPPLPGDGGPRWKVFRTKQFRFLDKAMMIDEKDATSETRDPWRLSTLRQVEDVKKVIRLLPVWLTCFPFSIVIAQFFTFFLKQATSMKGPQLLTHFKLPVADIPFFITCSVILFLLVLYDRVLVPYMSKLTGNPTGITTLQRIGIGQFLSMLTMVIAALVERKRVSVANGLLSIWWLLPQYFVLGVAEVFVVVGMQQLFYEKMPEGLRSLGAAAYVSVLAIGSFISSGIIAVVQTVSERYHDKWLVDDLNKAHLDGFYWVLAGLCGLGFCGYVWVASVFVNAQVEREDGNEGYEMEI